MKKELATFNAKETEIIRLICQEFSNREIADRLHLGVRTIEGYRKQIQEKMKVKNTAGMVVYAVKNNIF
jgi:DNA-binding CsgD family transcriptional regulator